MKKLLGIVFLGLLLSACASNDKIVNSGKLKQNLTNSTDPSFDPDQCLIDLCQYEAHPNY